MVVGLACSGGAGRSRTDLLGFAIRCITALLPRHWILWNVSSAAFALEQESGAGNESRTRDLNLGKVALYQLSYSRVEARHYTCNLSKFEKNFAFLFHSGSCTASHGRTPHLPSQAAFSAWWLAACCARLFCVLWCRLSSSSRLPPQTLPAHRYLMQAGAAAGAPAQWPIPRQSSARG